VRIHILSSRFAIVILAVLMVSAAVCSKLVYLQVIHSEEYKAEAREQAQGLIKIELPRPEFLDRNGTILAGSVEKASLCVVKPQEIEDVSGLANQVSRLSGEPAQSIISKLTSRKGFTWLARKLPEDKTGDAEKIASAFDGVSLVREWGRDYPKGRLAANLIGTVGTDGGLSGLEDNWNKQLNKGEREYIIFRVGKRTRLYPIESLGTLVEEPPSIILTIDEAIQFEVEKALDEAWETYNPTSATAIVMSVPDGEILALGVRPNFDPNKPAETRPRDWRNIAVLDSFEPGSTFKMITIAAALETGRLKPYDEIFVGNGSLTIGDHTIHDDHPPHKAYYSVEEVMTYSSNCGAARIGMMLQKQTFYDYITEKFGFGRLTRLRLKGETPGYISRPKSWSALSAPSIAFGQEIRVSPLQLALAYGIVASKGMRVTPKIIKDFPSPPPERVLSESTAFALTKMLETVVNDGTGKSAQIPLVEVAGKTGTAQKLGVKIDAGRKGRIAYFAGFAPAENPRIVTLVMVDDPIGQIYGGAVSAPLFAKITSFALKRLNVPFTPYHPKDIALLTRNDE
jgi:cell division protein FtsI (penicillin-binding protein 3)